MTRLTLDLAHGRIGRHSPSDQCFFSGLPLLQGQVVSVALNDGFAIEFSVSSDLFHGAAICVGKTATAWLLAETETLPVAVLEAVILSEGVGAELSLPEACDLISEAVQQTIIELGRTSATDLSCVLEIGSLFIVKRLEVRSGFRSLGLSKLLVECILSELSSQFTFALMALKPFPLQYQHAEPEFGSSAYVEFWNKFQKDKEKLSSFYSYEFECVSASYDTDLLIKPLSGFVGGRNSSGWIVNRSE